MDFRSWIFLDFYGFSQIFVDFLRFSQIFVDFRRGTSGLRGLKARGIWTGSQIGERFSGDFRSA